VDALYGMSAGPAGFTTLFGGMNVGGIGVAIPGQQTVFGDHWVSPGLLGIGAQTSFTNTSGTTQSVLSSAITSIGAAFGSIFGSDLTNSSLHNIHSHVTKAGAGTPPIPPEVPTTLV
jgi:hypothetical protein